MTIVPVSAFGLTRAAPSEEGLPDGLIFQLTQEQMLPPGWENGWGYSTASRAACLKLARDPRKIAQFKIESGRDVFCIVRPDR